MKLDTDALAKGYLESPPARRRGLKRVVERDGEPWFVVASRAEAWIETHLLAERVLKGLVASRAEAWIETAKRRPLWLGRRVASRAEAWIETWIEDISKFGGKRRLPRGGVD